MDNTAMVNSCMKLVSMRKEWEKMNDAERAEWVKTLRGAVAEENKRNVDRYIRDLCVSMPDNDVARDKNAFFTAWLKNPYIGKLSVKHKVGEKPVVAVTGVQTVTASHILHYFKFDNPAMYNACVALKSTFDGIASDVANLQLQYINNETAPSVSNVKERVESFAKRFDVKLSLRSQDVRYLVVAMGFSKVTTDLQTADAKIRETAAGKAETVIVTTFYNMLHGVKYSRDEKTGTVKLTDNDKRTIAIISGEIE